MTQREINNSYLLEKIKAEDLSFLKDMVENNRLKPVIYRTYTFDQIVEAHRYVDTNRKKGKCGNCHLIKEYSLLLLPKRFFTPTLACIKGVEKNSYPQQTDSCQVFIHILSTISQSVMPVICGEFFSHLNYKKCLNSSLAMA